MKETKKQYWKGLEELTKDPEFVKYADKEFPEYLPIGDEESEGSTRRDFLKLMGFGMAAVTLASCEAPIRNAIPYVIKPVDVDPGVPNYYASTYMQGGDYCSVVVKTREGRPIKVEGNKLSKISQGGVNAQVEASVLSLYDKERLTGPLKDGKETDWATLDKEVVAKLGEIAAKGGQIRLVSNTILSPTTLKVIGDFKAKYGNVELVQYDTQSGYGITKSNKEVFGIAAIPTYHFDKADVIVSFDGDFLGTWISPIEYTKGFSKTRKLGPDKKTMSRLYHYESNLSLTGANADYRTPIKPSEQGQAVIALYNAVASKTGNASVSGGGDFARIKEAAADLVKAKGKSIVVSGSNDPAIQTLVAGINDMLSNYGSTITWKNYSYARKGDDAQMNSFIADTKAGKVDAVIFLNTNPVYNHPKGAELAEGLKKVTLTVSTSDRKDETASLVNYVATNHHYLESWNDAEPKNGMFSLIQPAITPIFKTRQQEETLLTWAGNSTAYFDYLKNYWQERFGNGKAGYDYQSFWDKCLQDGVYEVPVEEPSYTANVNASGAASAVAKNYKGQGVELVLYTKIAVGDGTQANNPWLQETPDPITKATWDNYITISNADAREWKIKEYEGKFMKGELVVNGKTYKLPMVIQPGQAKGTVGVALGFGRTSAGKVANDLGVDVTPLIATLNGANYYSVTTGVDIKPLPDEKYQVARTQTHQTYMDRDNVIQEATLKEYQKNPMAGRDVPMVATWQDKEGKVESTSLSLWKGHKYPDHHWGMAIDLNACTGCSACHVSCQAENNIPVVGRQEVINRRDMHWMRIDRYYSSNQEDVAKADGMIDRFRALDEAADNPEVTFQPMMCQHCNNAGCETVCPVAATTHSSSGINQMTYNRCIGTRYCANNCAYKVRRFNWFKYHDNEQFDKNLSMNNDLGKMVLNPDVTVRSRGVMEKCSLCMQRIQLGKLEAKKEKRRTNDGDIVTACAAACPADAIVFGDMNDDNSRISQLLRIKNKEGDYGIDKQVNEERAYTVLEETGSKPNVLYLTKIRNKQESNA
ncbi:MAG: TAT-variant-translocated molybdopterin oxidoreductase [Cyclobacteriaceae bacterium]|nr:TAT-variant-translocated molybdopterin oxidoreductase [Cyclobacteriaceae bacterium]